jgi:hypothetical protein
LTAPVVVRDRISDGVVGIDESENWKLGPVNMTPARGDLGGCAFVNEYIFTDISEFGKFFRKLDFQSLPIPIPFLSSPN